MNIGIITGSGFYSAPEFENRTEKKVETVFGTVTLVEADSGKHRIFFIARHGKDHLRLPNMINYRANILALKQNGVELIIATSVMGILDPGLPMANLFLFDDLFFPDNRLPDGEICSIYTEPGAKERGHYLFGTPFSQKARELAFKTAEKENIPVKTGLVYGHANGPRFNSKTEIAFFRSAGCQTISQTAGPEIILAGECEIPYLLLGFGIDYANGVKEEPTPVEVLNENLGKSKDIFSTVIKGILEELKEDEEGLFDNGFVYRFE